MRKVCSAREENFEETQFQEIQERVEINSD